MSKFKAGDRVKSKLGSTRGSVGTVLLEYCDKRSVCVQFEDDRVGWNLREEFSEAQILSLGAYNRNGKGYWISIEEIEIIDETIPFLLSQYLSTGNLILGKDSTQEFYSRIRKFLDAGS